MRFYFMGKACFEGLQLTVHDFSFTKIAILLRNKLLQMYISRFWLQMQNNYFAEHLLIASSGLKSMAASYN